MRLRQCVLPEISGLKEAVCEPSLVNEVNNLKIDVSFYESVIRIPFHFDFCNGWMFSSGISDLFSSSCFRIIVHIVYKVFFFSLIQPYTNAKELYIATLKDIQMWNKREMRVGLEWAKTFDLFNQLSLDDRVSSLLRFLRIIFHCY